jgi:hypothetical protein
MIVEMVPNQQHPQSKQGDTQKMRGKGMPGHGCDDEGASSCMAEAPLDEGKVKAQAPWMKAEVEVHTLGHG